MIDAREGRDFDSHGRPEWWLKPAGEKDARTRVVRLECQPSPFLFGKDSLVSIAQHPSLERRGILLVMIVGVGHSSSRSVPAGGRGAVVAGASGRALGVLSHGNERTGHSGVER